MSELETAALVVLLQLNRRRPAEYSELVESRQSAIKVLKGELASDEDGQTRLHIESDQDALVASAAASLREWANAGIQIKTVLDPDYPDNLRMVHDRPPLLFIRGRLGAQDRRSLAVIGSRNPTEQALERAQQIAAYLAGDGYTITSGLAAGIDTQAHTTALAKNARTIAVIGTGLHHAYPPVNAPLQHEIASKGAVVSQFWPDDGPTKTSFPLRNAVMSGLTLGSVIVEASHTSGARTQARFALAHGRPVFLHATLQSQEWARELSQRPGTHVFREPQEVTAQIARLTETGSLVA
jgi:DNA processing protein